MIVILNVKITSIRIGHPYNNGRGPWQPVSNRFDIFKYCLASYAVLNPLVSAYHFYIQLEGEFESRQVELQEYIEDLFPADKLHLHWHRNNYTRDWRQVCESILPDDNEVIWFGGNDDHIFIDYNLDMVKAAIDTLNAEPDPNAVVYYSHWPEQMRMSHVLGGELTADRNFIKFNWDNFDGIHIFKASRFKRYWYDADYGNSMVFRPDDLHNHFGYSLPAVYYAPTRELVRHYDGYVHVGKAVTNQAPALFIPPGFFERAMRIRCGFNHHDSLCTNLNPASVNIYNTDSTAADYRFIEADIPLFWHGHISDISYAPDYDTAYMNMMRNKAFLDVTRTPMSCFGYTFTEDNHPPTSWFLNQLRG